MVARSSDLERALRTLNLPREALPCDVKPAYHRLALKHHPDKGGSKSEFARIKSAYDTLMAYKPRSRATSQHQQSETRDERASRPCAQPAATQKEARHAARANDAYSRPADNGTTSQKRGNAPDRAQAESRSGGHRPPYTPPRQARDDKHSNHYDSRDYRGAQTGARPAPAAPRGTTPARETPSAHKPPPSSHAYRSRPQPPPSDTIYPQDSASQISAQSSTAQTGAPIYSASRSQNSQKPPPRPTLREYNKSRQPVYVDYRHVPAGAPYHRYGGYVLPNPVINYSYGAKPVNHYATVSRNQGVGQRGAAARQASMIPGLVSYGQIYNNGPTNVSITIYKF